MIKSVAILTRPDNKSPRVLAQSFKSMCEEISVKADIYYQGSGFLGRLLSVFQKRYFPKRLHFIVRQKLFNFFNDQLLIIKLKKYDLIVLSECIPNAYWKRYYDIEKLKKKIKKPIALYEVYYLGNSITHTNYLQLQNHHGVERFDWNFSVSDIAEIRSLPSPSLRWSSIGLHLANCGLKPTKKKDIIALIDFAQIGFEDYRIEQIRILESFPQIKLIYLKGEYTFDQIRDLYQQASLIFIQFPEAYGVSIAECLSAGCKVVVKEEEWAMSWRLVNESNDEYLPDCFFVYDNSQLLQAYLKDYIANFIPEKNAFDVHASFMQHYPHFYYGNKSQLLDSFKHIENYKFYDQV